MALPPPTADELAGRALYGDRFDAAALAEWFAAETDAYAALVPDDGENRTAALSAHHLLRVLGERRAGARSRVRR